MLASSALHDHDSVKQFLFYTCLLSYAVVAANLPGKVQYPKYPRRLNRLVDSGPDHRNAILSPAITGKPAAA